MEDIFKASFIDEIEKLGGLGKSITKGWQTLTGARHQRTRDLGLRGAKKWAADKKELGGFSESKRGKKIGEMMATEKRNKWIARGGVGAFGLGALGGAALSGNKDK